MNVEEEVGKLKEEIQRLGQQQPDGSYKVTIPLLPPRLNRRRSEASDPLHRIVTALGSSESGDSDLLVFCPSSRFAICNVM
jgi:hypothetical protein